jgi:hypothetical protein
MLRQDEFLTYCLIAFIRGITMVPYIFATYFLLLGSIPAQTAAFSLENLTKIIQDDRRLFRVVYPEKAFKDVPAKFRDPDNLFLEYIEKPSPVRNFDECCKLTYLQVRKNYIIPLEISWSIEHKKLHELLVKTALNPALEANREYYENNIIDNLTKQYVNFFFRPLESLTNKELSPFDIANYQASSPACPIWLKEFLEKAHDTHAKEFNKIYGKMQSIADELKTYNFEYVKKKSSLELAKYGYNYTLQELVEALVRPYAELFKLDDKATSEAEKLIASNILVILAVYYDISTDELASQYEEIRVNENFSRDLLSPNDNLFTQTKISKKSRKSLLQKKEVILNFNFQHLNDTIVYLLQVSQYSFGVPTHGCSGIELEINWEAKD